MPSKSKAQFKKMEVLHSEGKISDAQLKDFNSGIDYKKLPERVKHKAIDKAVKAGGMRHPLVAPRDGIRSTKRK